MYLYIVVHENTSFHTIIRRAIIIKELKDEDNPIYGLIENGKLREAWQSLKVQGNPLSDETWVKLWNCKTDLFKYNLIKHMHSCGMPIHAGDDILLAIMFQQEHVNPNEVDYLLEQDCSWISNGCKAIFNFYAWSSKENDTDDINKTAWIKAIESQLKIQYPDIWNYVQQAVHVGLPHYYAIDNIESLDVPTITS